MYTLEAFARLCVDKDEGVEERERLRWVLEETNVIKDGRASSFHSFLS